MLALTCVALRGFGVIARSSGHVYPHVPGIANVAFFVRDKIAVFSVMMVLQLLFCIKESFVLTALTRPDMVLLTI